MSRLWFPPFFLFLFLSICGSLNKANSQTAQPVWQVNPAAEEWIKQQVAKEEEADAIKEFGNDGSVIRASFLAELLKNPPKGIAGNPQTFVSIKATVTEDFDLIYADIPYALNLTGCHFLNQVDLSHGIFQKDLYFESSVFERGADFDHMKVAGTFWGFGCKFRGVVFEYTQIGGDLVLDKATFGDEAGFYEMKVTGDAHFDSTVFNGTGISFANAEVTKDLTVTRATFKNKDADVSFSSMKVGGDASFSETKFGGGAQFSGMIIGGILGFYSVRATNDSKVIDFTNLKADDLIFDDSEIKAPYILNGMTYRLIQDVQRQTDNLANFVDQAWYKPNNPDNYTNLEAFYQKQGNFEGAKDVRIAWKKRERAQLGFLHHPFKYIWNLIQYITTAYGQHLQLALVWSIGFIFLGYFVFRREDWMETKNKDDAERFKHEYQPLWYSIALFLPVISLQDKDIWVPRLDRRKTGLYMRLHIILGYLLIPIGLAAWTGLIK